MGGNLARFEVGALVLTANIAQFPSLELALARTKDRNAPLDLRSDEFLSSV